MTIPAAATGGLPGSSAMRRPRRQPRFPVLRRTPLVWCMGILLMTYIWRIHDLYPILGTLQLPSVISLIVYALFYMDVPAMQRMRPMLKNRTLRITFLIFGLMVLSIPFSLFHGLSFNFVFQDHIKVVLMMIILASMIRGMQDVTDTVVVLVVGAMVYGILLFTRFEIGARGELQGLVFYDANDLGMLFACTMPFSVYFLKKGTPAWQRLLGIFTLALFAICIVKTGSRGAFLGMIAVGLYLLFFYRGVAAGFRWGLTLVGLIVVVSTSTGDYWTRIATIFSPSEDYNFSGNNEEGRMEVWKRGMTYMKTHPITGVGVQCFPVAEGTISPLASRQEQGVGLKWSAAHNSWVQIGAELGVGGIIAFTYLIFGTMKRVRGIAKRIRAKNKKEPTSEEAFASALFCSYLGFVVTGFFLSQAYSVFLYALLGLTVGFMSIIEPDGDPTLIKKKKLQPAPARGQRGRPPR